MTDILAQSQIEISATDKTGPGVASAKKSVGSLGDSTDQLKTKLTAAQVELQSRLQQVEKAFGAELRAMQTARMELAAVQKQLDTLGSGNRDIARSILGTRSTADIANEIKLVTSALASLKANAGVGPMELARASEAAKAKVAELRRELEGVGPPAKQTGSAFDFVSGAVARYLSVAALAVGGYKLSKEFIETSDSLKLLHARLTTVTGSSAEGQRAFAGLVEDARRLRVPIEDTVGGFARIAASVRELGGTTEEARKLNEILLGTAKISGIAGDEAASAARQFAQALGSGVLQGDELRSILENNLELAQQLAAGLGVSIGELRKLGSEGKLTADVVANALLARLPEIQAKLKDVPLTTADAFTALKNEMVLFVDQTDKATGASTRFAGGVNSMAGAVRELRLQFDGDWLSKMEALNNAAAFVTAPGLAVARLNANAADRTPSVNLRQVELDMEKANAIAEKSALGVSAAAKRAYDDAAKLGADFLTKQQKVTVEFGEQMQTIARAIDAQRKSISTAPAGAAGAKVVAEATERITQLERLRGQAMSDVVKKIAEANAADAKKSTTLKELTANQKAFNSTLEQVTNIAQGAQEQLDQMFMSDSLTKAEVALRKLENSDAWKKLTADQKAYISDTLVAAAETQRLVDRLKAQASAAGGFAEQQAKEKAAWKKEVEQAGEAVDRLVEKLQAETRALQSNGGMTNEQAQALRKLQDDLDNGLIPSMEEYERRVLAVNDAFARRDSAQAWVDANKAAVAQQRKDYEDLYRSIDDLTSQLWAAVTEKGGNAFEKVTEVLKSTLLATLYKMVAQPFIVNIAAQITGVAVPGGQGGAGGGFDLSKIFSAGNSTDTLGSLSEAWDGFMADLDHGVSVFDAAKTALSNYSGTFQQVLGGAAIGYGVGTLSHSLFGNSRNQMGMQVGGTLGGTVGMAVGGPLGSFIGSLIGSAIGSLFKSGGGPKSGGFSSIGDISSIRNTDGGGRWFTPNSADASLVKTLDTVNTGFATIAKALGLSAGQAGFALGFDTDPKGTAPNRIHAGAFVNGQQVYDAALGDLGRDDAVLQARLELESKRILFAAIQASLGDAPAYIQQLFAGIEAATASGDQIDEILNTAQALKGLVDQFATMGDTFNKLDAEQIRSLVEAFGGVENFAAAAQYVGENFTTMSQKVESTMGQLETVFDSLGLKVPETHQGFLDLLAGLDLTDEAQQQTYATLMALAPAWIAVNGTAEEAAAAAAELAASLDEARGTLAGFNGELALLDDAQLQGIADAVGGLASLNTLLGDFNDNFIGDAQRQQAAMQETAETFARLGIVVPRSNKEFVALVNSIDVSTAEGQQLYATLLQVSKAFALANGTAQEHAILIGTGKSFFNENFYTQAEQAATRIDSAWSAVHHIWTQFGGELMELGYNALPTTNDGFRTMIERLRGLGMDDLADELVAYSSVIFGLNQDIASLADSAEEASDAVERLNAAYQQSVELAGQAQNTFASAMSAIDDLVSQSGGDFGQKLALKLSLIPEQIRKYELLMEALYQSGDIYSPLMQQYRQILIQLGAANDKATKELARFTVLTAQYGAERAEQLVQLEAWYAQTQEALAGNVDALAALKVIFDQRWADILNGTAGGVDGALSEFERLQKGIREFLDSLKLSELSPLTPTQRLAEAKGQYEELLAKANAGDLEAMAKITGAAEEYLKIARDYFASSSAYTEIFNSVTAALERLATMEQPKTQADASAALMAALPTNGKLVSAQDLKEGLDTLAAEFAESIRSLAASNSADSRAEQQVLVATTEMGDPLK